MSHDPLSSDENVVRALETLVADGLVEEVDFGDGERRWQISDAGSALVEAGLVVEAEIDRLVDEA